MKHSNSSGEPSINAYPEPCESMQQDLIKILKNHFNNLERQYQQLAGIVEALRKLPTARPGVISHYDENKIM